MLITISRLLARKALARLKTAGWWQANPQTGQITPPPVDKGGLQNAILGCDPADDGHTYVGDWPADILDDALSAIDLAYRKEWGRPASPVELQAVWNFCFGPFKDAQDWPQINEWVDAAAEIAGVPSTAITALPDKDLEALRQAHRDYRAATMPHCSDCGLPNASIAQQEWEFTVKALLKDARGKAQKVLGLKVANRRLKQGQNTEAGLFIPLPRELAEQFPDLGEEDKSPPHATFLYVGTISKGRQAAFLQVCQRVLKTMRGATVEAHLEGPEYFVHPAKERRVAVMHVRFSHDLAGLRWRLRDALIDAGFTVDDSFPLIFRPHVTLEYLDGLASQYTGKVPTGSWTFSGMKVWGLGQPKQVTFGMVPVR